MGTNLFFGKDNNLPPLDNLNDVNPTTVHKYIGKSEKILKMHRIFVEDNCNQNESSTEETSQEMRKRFELKMTYGEALNMIVPSDLFLNLLSVLRQHVRPFIFDLQLDLFVSFKLSSK